METLRFRSPRSSICRWGKLSGLVLVLLLGGCQLTKSAAPSRVLAEPEIRASSPGVMKRYSAFHVPEIQVLEVEGDILRRVSSGEARNLAEMFRSKLVRQLGSRYSSFSHPARDVAVINITISDLSSTYALAQLAPGLLVQNALRGGASIEARVIDSVSGEEVLTFKDTRQGERQGFFSGLRKWDGVEMAFDEWASKLGAAIL